MSKETRVVVTGVGGVTPLGPTRNKEGNNEFWRNLTAGKSAIADIKSLKGVGVFERIKGAEIHDWRLEDYLDSSKIDRKVFRRISELDKMIQFALAATKLSIDDSCLENLDEVGFYTGNAMQGIGVMEKLIMDTIQKYAVLFGEELISEISPFTGDSFDIRSFPNALKNVQGEMKAKLEELKREGIKDYKRINLFSLFKALPPTIFNFTNYAISGQIASFFKIHGPTLAVNSSCSAGSDAIGNAYNIIKNNDSDVMIAGGSDAPIAYSILSMCNKLKVISKNGVKPGDIDRDGFALGEGAGYIVLEELKHACKRNARIYSEIVAYSQSNDGYNMVALDPNGDFIKNSIYQTLKKANMSPSDIDYINPHGTSTKDCDSVESRIIQDVFGDSLEKIVVNPTKCFTGHLQAGAGAVEAIIINSIFENDFIPGTIEPTKKDGECVNYIPKSGLKKRINT
ncbi:MAG: beta-ketoacyl-[acyl-carrier-protein] synthase family protein, partial [Nanoarchaeota archaeon]